MRSFFPAIVVLIALLGFLALFFGFVPTAFTYHELVLANRRGGDVVFQVRIADDDDERRRGLQQVDYLGEREGMWFIFPNSAPRNFWMKDTLIPLDIVFLDSNSTIISFHLNVPPCREVSPSQEDCPSYPSSGPAQFVLELVGGTAQRYGLQVGDVLTLAD